MTPPGFASELAMERHRCLRPHLGDGVPLARLAAAGGPSTRTLRRWPAGERPGLPGASGRRGPTAATGAGSPSRPRGAGGLARPRPTAAAVHRRVCALAAQRGLAAPSYAALTEIVRSVSPEARAAATRRPGLKLYADED